MRGGKGEPGTYCSRMRPIFQDFLFSPYISVDGDAMKSRFSKFCLYTWLYSRHVLASLFVLTRCVRHCAIAVASDSR